jgi:hypothetical protein
MEQSLQLVEPEQESSAHSDGLESGTVEGMDSDSELAREVLAVARKQRRRILRGVSALLTSWALLYGFLWMFETVGVHKGWFLPEGVIGPFLGISFLGSMALCALFALPGKQQRDRLKKLARTADLSAIGPIVEMVREIQPRGTRAALREALAELVPRLKETDMLLLTTSQRTKLHHLLHDAATHDRDPSFAISLLKGLEQIGDEQTVRAIGKVMAMSGRGEKWSRLRKAAEEALEVITVRIERRKSPSVLLRAAAPEQPESALLRPASSGSAAQAAALLRSASNEQAAP